MSGDDGLQRRLEALNRAPLPSGASQSSGASSTAASVPPTADRPVRSLPPRTKLVAPLAGLFERGEELGEGANRCWRIVVEIDEVWSGGGELARKRGEFLRSLPLPQGADFAPCRSKAVGETPGAGADCREKSRPLAPREEDLLAERENYNNRTRSPTPGSGRIGGHELSAHTTFPPAFPERVLYLDLETCGLAGSALFLIGLLRWMEGRLAIELLLARDYGEERAVLIELWRRMPDVDLLVTFNGKSFDWPMVLDRSRRHLLGKEFRLATPSHLDVLHVSRRRWRGLSPDFKLQTLERRFCGRCRGEDIAGALIPAAYQQFVRTRRTNEINRILCHNATDLATLLDLSLRLAPI